MVVMIPTPFRCSDLVLLPAALRRLRIDEVNGVLEAMMVEHGAKHAGLGELWCCWWRR